MDKSTKFINGSVATVVHTEIDFEETGMCLIFVGSVFPNCEVDLWNHKRQKSALSTVPPKYILELVCNWLKR